MHFFDCFYFLAAVLLQARGDQPPAKVDAYWPFKCKVFCFCATWMCEAGGCWKQFDVWPMILLLARVDGVLVNKPPPAVDAASLVLRRLL